MIRKFKNKQEEIEHEQKYLEFLKKALDSENYKKNVSADKYQQTKEKYNKVKFRLKILKG
jgi:uncharacterized protein YPO0396